MRDDLKPRVLLGRGQLTQLPADIEGSLVLGAHQVKPPEAEEDRGEIRGRTKALAQLAGPPVRVLHVAGHVAVDRRQRLAQGGPHGQLVPVPLGRVGQCGKHVQGPLEMANGLLGRTSPQHLARCLLQVAHRPLVLPPALEVLRQLGRDVLGLPGKTFLESTPDPAVQLYPAPGRHPFVQDLLIEGVGERVTTGDCPVRPLGRPSRPQDMSSHQSRTPLLDVLRLLGNLGGDKRGGKFLSSHAGRFEQRADRTRRAEPAAAR